MDAVQQANSGHPGMPMGMADMAEVLWNDFLRHNPSNPDWANRDRFVVSNGHGSMLLYSLLHLSGYDLSMEDLKSFRQLHSKTPGHPEYGMTPGVETTTGPLGQGIATAVGMALGEKLLAARYNREGHDIVDHYTYVFTGDGCLMEGISHEACSLAGTLGLDKLIVLYDDNNISIDGEIDGWFTDNTPQRFEAYGWHVVPEVDGHDPDSLRRALEEARQSDKPSILCCKTVIGFGSPNLAGTSKTHGSPLGHEEIAAVRQKLGWEHGPFEIPEDVYAGWNACARGASAEQQWNEAMNAYRAAFPELSAELERRLAGDLPADFADQLAEALVSTQNGATASATRKASGKALEFLGPILPELLGGSADLTGSNNTNWSGSVPVNESMAEGNYVYYGVREFAMTAMLNGLALHGGFLPYAGTFLVFSDYARNAVRLAAMMKLRSVFVYTHDSIGLGEDGPTHQPVEHLASLGLIPNLDVWRPCDAVETMAAWKSALERKDGPSCLVFTRQNTVHQERNSDVLAAVERGGYVLRDCEGTPEVILLGTGSEVELATGAAEQLSAEGVAVRVVSVPCMKRFEAQTAEYRESVLPAAVTARLAIEAGVPNNWWGYVSSPAQVMGIETFGESAPAKVLFEHFGLTVSNVVERAKSLL
jgi:transketolase